jgi:Fic family protein
LDRYEKVRCYWQSLHVESTDELDWALDNFRIQFAYNSGKIENDEISYHDTREIFENGKVTGYTGSTRALFEQQNQKLCYDYLKGPIVRKEPISVELIKQIHAILTAGTFDEHQFIERGERPGEFKKHDYIIGINEVGCLPEKVEETLTERLCELQDLPADANMMKAASYFHAVFENIHLFSDGNGRVGRTLMNYFLMTHDEPPIIVYDEDKRLYYAALEKYDTDESIDELYLFLKDQTCKTWEKTVDRFNSESKKV